MLKDRRRHQDVKMVVVLLLIICNLLLLNLYLKEKVEKTYPLLGTYCNSTGISNDSVYFCI